MRCCGRASAHRRMGCGLFQNRLLGSEARRGARSPEAALCRDEHSCFTWSRCIEALGGDIDDCTVRGCQEQVDELGGYAKLA
mmetsp:Transcript_3805/g.8026  ORF Transcript_3805/g.8026 Transcript_3805/m.8026 type:complete len:82 (+) Transcript_3805:571-816(+)